MNKKFSFGHWECEVCVSEIIVMVSIHGKELSIDSKVSREYVIYIFVV